MTALAFVLYAVALASGGQGASSPAYVNSREDYPPEALRKGEQGTVEYLLEVGVNGRVTACHIAQSSGSAQLDEATCKILSTRARFTPARDKNGNPVEDTFAGRLTWKIGN